MIKYAYGASSVATFVFILQLNFYEKPILACPALLL